MTKHEVAFLFQHLGEALQRASESLPDPRKGECPIDTELTWLFCSLSSGLEEQAKVILDLAAEDPAVV